MVRIYRCFSQKITFFLNILMVKNNGKSLPNIKVHTFWVVGGGYQKKFLVRSWSTKGFFFLWLGVLFLRKPYFLVRCAKFLHNWFFLHVFCPFFFFFFLLQNLLTNSGEQQFVIKKWLNSTVKKTQKNLKKKNSKKKEKNCVKKNTAKLLQIFFLKIVYNSFNKTLQVNYMVMNFAEWY